MKLGSIVLSLVVTCAIGSAVACGDSDAEKAQQAAAKSEAQELDEFLTTYCQIILPCCNKVLQKDKNDVAGCKTRLQALDPVSIKDKDARVACITQAKAAAPDPVFCSDFAQAVTPACPDAHRAMLVGMKKPGEICGKADDCAPDYSGTVDCTGGVCQLRKRGAESDGPCDTTIDGDVTTSLAQPADGTTVYTCFLSGDGLQCDPGSKTCVKPATVGERAACDNSGVCDKTEYCDADEKHCFPKHPKNNKCDVDDECNGHCNVEDKDKGGFCADKVDADEDCDSTQWCMDGLECVSGKCTEPGADARLAKTCGG